MLLNLVLLAVISGAVWRLRVEWLAAQAREQALLKRGVKPAPAPPYSPLPKAEPVLPANFADIAQKMLFSRDRNPTVVVETAPPPPPKPMPPLPVLRGVMNLGDGPTAIMSEKKGAEPRDFRPGQQVGEFKLVAINNQEIVLNWDGKEVRKKVDDLIDHSVEESATSASQARSAAPAAASAQPAAPLVQSGPGVEMGKGLRACVKGDTAPAGTVVDGLKKVVSESPFGQVCRWEAVK